MLIEEIVRSCVHERIAQVAVACIGHKFSAEIEDAAAGYGMSAGAFAAFSVSQFARSGDEAELRAVRAAMSGAQEPVLAGLHKILCIMLAAEIPSSDQNQRRRDHRAKLQAGVERMDAERRLDYVC